MSKSKQQLVSEFLTSMMMFRRIVDTSIVMEDKVGTFLQLHALEQIEDKSPIVVSNLASAIGASNSSTSQLTDRLFDAGYISREGDLNDRRIVRIVLTKKGKEYLNLLQKAIKNEAEKKVSMFSEQDLIDLTRIFNNFLKKFSNKNN